VQRHRLQGKKFNAAYIPTPQIEVSWKLALLVLFALLVVAVEDRLVGCSVVVIILVRLASSARHEVTVTVMVTVTVPVTVAVSLPVVVAVAGPARSYWLLLGAAFYHTATFFFRSTVAPPHLPQHTIGATATGLSATGYRLDVLQEVACLS
jgi:hypothetical protein